MILSLETKEGQWPLSIAIGFLCWLALLIFFLPYTPFEITHVQFLLLAAPLWLVPLGWRLLHVPRWVELLALPFALSFSLAFLMNSGLLATLLALPWLLLCLSLAIKKIKDWWLYKKTELSTLSLLAASLYLPVGAAWGVADRIGFMPFDFSPTITLLTSVHFHYAGFILPLMLGLALREFPCLLSKFIGWGIISGITLVAVGIMSTHFGWSAWIEVLTVTIMTLSAFGAGMMHVNLAWRHRKESGAILWVFSGLALMVGMALAFCYGWRSVFSIEMLTIPWMYAVHGTLNAIGFAIPGLLAWSRAENALMNL